MGNYAKVALIFAQTDPALGHKGLACFLVDTDQPGYKAQTIEHKMGLHASDTASISLEDVEVSDEDMLGEVGDGFKVAMSNLDSGRYSVAAGCVGICQGCVEESVKYAKEREQFGRPIASFQLVQAMIADMVLKTDASRMLVWRAGLLKDKGRPNTLETSIAKLHATEASLECANLAIQVHGGAGYVDDHPVERYFRDARVTTLYEGTSQIQKLIIGRAMTGINALVPVLSAAASKRADARDRSARSRMMRPARPAGTGSAASVIGVLGAGTMGCRHRPAGVLARARARCCTTRSPRRSSAGLAARAGRARQRSRARASEPQDAARAARRAPAGGRRPGGARAVRAGDRGGARAPGAQARALPAPVGDRERGVRAGEQHLLAARDGDRRRRPATPSGSSACTSSTRRR